MKGLTAAASTRPQPSQPHLSSFWPWEMPRPQTVSSLKGLWALARLCGPAQSASSPAWSTPPQFSGLNTVTWCQEQPGSGHLLFMQLCCLSCKMKMVICLDYLEGMWRVKLDSGWKSRPWRLRLRNNKGGNKSNN